MKFLSMLAMVFALSLSVTAGDAEAAKRLGGGKSSGMQRESTTLNQPGATPAQTPAAAPAMAAKQSTPAAAAAQPAKRSWMGPLAGLAAGLGLAALASHFGFGEELASMMLIGLAIAAAMVAISYFMRRRGNAPSQQMQYAATGLDAGPNAIPEYSAPPVASGSARTEPVRSGNIPADFDTEGFVRNAKINFLRLQAANDAGNLEDIREFTSPEMFAEIKLSLAERGTASQEIDVVALNANVVDVAEEDNRYIVSVRFTGQIREDKTATPEALDEIWHLTKAKAGQGGWVIAGIQQTH